LFSLIQAPCWKLFRGKLFDEIRRWSRTRSRPGVSAMMLNEFHKEHREVQELKKQVAALTAGL
jgi:hypothetical protein